MAKILGFPNPVDEVSARLVAGGVVTMSVVTLATRQPLFLLPIAFGFWARVLTGPKLSPLGRLVTQVIRPRLKVAPRLVDGPPKRFAQGMGATMSTLAVIIAFGFGSTLGALIIVGMIIVAASLEAFFAYCLGCKVFGLLIRAGVVPDSVCAECADISLRRQRLAQQG